jgi:FAD:protein FMN transferase
MPSHSDIEVRRCRPLLGTFVEIVATGPSAETLHAAADAAFTVIEDVQRSMSAHDPQSELSKVNRDAALAPVRVDEDLFQVLGRAASLSEASEGAFDVTVGSVLAKWGMRPRELRRRRAGTWRDIVLGPNRTVAFKRPLALDLGGIAKGYAVDAAFDELQRRGVRRALVNAGGDLRAIGRRGFKVHLRHPADPRRLAHEVNLRNAALATSSPCFTEKRWRGQTVSHLAAPGGYGALTGPVSATVRAPECWLADALAKIVLLAPDRAARILELFAADAIVLAA